MYNTFVQCSIQCVHAFTLTDAYMHSPELMILIVRFSPWSAVCVMMSYSDNQLKPREDNKSAADLSDIKHV